MKREEGVHAGNLEWVFLLARVAGVWWGLSLGLNLVRLLPVLNWWLLPAVLAGQLHLVLLYYTLRGVPRLEARSPFLAEAAVLLALAFGFAWYAMGVWFTRALCGR